MYEQFFDCRQKQFFCFETFCCVPSCQCLIVTLEDLVIRIRVIRILLDHQCFSHLTHRCTFYHLGWGWIIHFRWNDRSESSTNCLDMNGQFFEKKKVFYRSVGTSQDIFIIGTFRALKRKEIMFLERSRLSGWDEWDWFNINFLHFFPFLKSNFFLHFSERVFKKCISLDEPHGRNVALFRCSKVFAQNFFLLFLRVSRHEDWRPKRFRHRCWWKIVVFLDERCFLVVGFFFSWRLKGRHWKKPRWGLGWWISWSGYTCKKLLHLLLHRTRSLALESYLLIWTFERKINYSLKIANTYLKSRYKARLLDAEIAIPNPAR